MMDAEQIIRFIGDSKKKTPVRVTLSESSPVEFPGCRVFGSGTLKIVYGEWEDIGRVIAENRESISDYAV